MIWIRVMSNKIRLEELNFLKSFYHLNPNNIMDRNSFLVLRIWLPILTSWKSSFFCIKSNISKSNHSSKQSSTQLKLFFPSRLQNNSKNICSTTLLTFLYSRILININIKQITFHLNFPNSFVVNWGHSFYLRAKILTQNN